MASMASSDADASMASNDADASMASSDAERPDDLLFPEEPDPQKAATDDALQPHPDDWASYTDDQRLSAPRGAVFETRLIASAALRELGNERYRGGDVAGARVAYARSLWQAHFDEAWVKLELTDDHRGQLFDVTVPANLNCARCLLKSSKTSEAKGHVDAALAALDDVPATDPRRAWRAKGLLLRATCLREAGRYADAAAALDEASELTDDAAVARARHALRQARRDARSGERAMMRGKIAPPPPPEKRTCAVS
jgi:tetratricopeptide (TPR) repeat protein